MFCRFSFYWRFSERLICLDCVNGRIGVGGTSVAKYGEAWETTLSRTIFGYSSVFKGESWSIMASCVVGNYGFGCRQFDHSVIGLYIVWVIARYTFNYLHTDLFLISLHFPSNLLAIASRSSNIDLKSSKSIQWFHIADVSQVAYRVA
jgi:hypothetical protein